MQRREAKPGQFKRASLSVKYYPVDSAGGALIKTLELIGSAITNGSRYHPIRAHAAGLATRAKAKDYLGQAKQIYDDFIGRWRYVHDPVTTEALTTTGNAIWSQTMGRDSRPGERGYGDCDDATIALGSMYLATGFPVRLNTISPPGSQKLFTHIYPSIKIPRFGWVDVDAVGHPTHGFGWTPPAARKAIWNLQGRLIGSVGQFPESFKRLASTLSGDTDESGGIDMSTFRDYGLENFGLAGNDLGDEEIANWNEYGLAKFGAYAGQMGLIDGDQLGFLMEYDEEDEIEGYGLVRTKMLEICPREMARIRRTGRPRPRMVALADDGDVYQWDDLGGFFKKLFKKAKKGVKKIGKGIAKGAKALHKGVVNISKKLISKLPGGKYLVKMYNKIHKVAMKLVKPLVKFVGKFAKKLAPIAALLPGYGPAIAGALYTSGKIAEVMQKAGVVTDSKGKPKFESDKQAKAFKRMLEEAAESHKRGTSNERMATPGARGAIARTHAAIQAQRRRAGVQQRKNPRLLREGTAEHLAVLRGYGVEC